MKKKPNYPRIVDELIINEMTQEQKEELARAMVPPIRGSTPSPFCLAGDAPMPYEEKDGYAINF